jgi:thiosulfate/3-mercaptopyruvate sulfurtransferase
VSSTLVSAEELARHAGDADWRIFDCRHDLRDTAYGEKAYAKEHIPGALFLHLDRDLSGATNGKNGRHPLPDPEVFAARMAACGVGPQTQVVAYDNEGNAFAARLWWLLRWIGHEKVAVLDGGLAGWRRAKQPMSAEVPKFPAAQLPVRKSVETVDADFVQSALGKPEMLLLDARSEERFAGQNETLDPVGGHIPGAVNRFFMDNLDDAGVYFKSVEELREDFDALLRGRGPEAVIQQCGSGVTACHNILAMEVAGLKGSRLYPGSWSEWCADPSRPVTTGP